MYEKKSLAASADDELGVELWPFTRLINWNTNFNSLLGSKVWNNIFLLTTWTCTRRHHPADEDE